MKKFSGGKFTASHTSIITAAHKPISAIMDMDCVKKISLGVITPIRNGSLSIKCMDEGPGCLLAKIRGSRSIQEIRIYTSDKKAVELALQDTLT